MTETGLRGRTRRAVQAELADAALALFTERGFDATTVEAIAAEVGMSRRSFFRYFSSKEDLVATKYGAWSDDMVATLTERPPAERPWLALRRTFDRIVDYYADAQRRENVLDLQDVVDRSPALRATTLAVYDEMQRRLATVLVDRTAGTRTPLDAPVTTAVVAVAWAAVQAALTESLPDHPESLGDQLDRMMTMLRPRGL